VTCSARTRALARVALPEATDGIEPIVYLAPPRYAARVMRALSFVAWVAIAAAATGGCAKRKAAHEVSHDLIRVTSDARLRTDTIGEGKWLEVATFVLVEAENTSKEGAYVTLTGELANEAGTTISELKPQSLWIPAGEIRTFALVDRERKSRPEAKGARIRVRGAQVSRPPPAHIDQFKQVTDGDKVLVQGTVTNEAARGGSIMVIASFYGSDGRPMTRPFSLVWLEPNAGQPVQFVGPPGSTRGTIFIGETAY
jgi:hypothetical protein